MNFAGNHSDKHGITHLQVTISCKVEDKWLSLGRDRLRAGGDSGGSVLGDDWNRGISEVGEKPSTRQTPRYP